MTRRSFVGTRARLRLACLLGLCANASLSSADELEGTPLHVAIGPGYYSQARYPGAESSRTLYFPFIDAEYDNRLYTSASDLLGIYGYKTEATQAGVALEWDPTHRHARDDERLQSLPNIKETARFKFFGSQTVAFVTVDGNIASDLLGRGQGTLAQTNLWLTAPLATGLSVSAGPGVSWADMHYMNSFFTVTAAQAAVAPRLFAYAARAGVLDAHLNTLAEWQLHTRYRIGLLTYIAHLRGDAEMSPVAVQRVQRTFLGWIAYKFR